MGHDMQTPLLQGEQQPTAPPLQAYPQIVAPGAPSLQSGHVVGIPSLPLHHQQHSITPITPPHGYPTPQTEAVAQQRTHLHAPEHPGLGRVSACPHHSRCPACRSAGPRIVRRENGCCAWVSAIAVFWVCCPLFWLPFCLDCDKDLVHRCSVCGTELERVKPWT